MPARFPFEWNVGKSGAKRSKIRDGDDLPRATSVATAAA